MLQNREGRKVPSATFRTRRGDAWVDVTTEELFAGRTVVVFSLPGAFTPTCSSAHVPRYNELAPALRRAGVDDIVCISVNDAFVMQEWQKDQGADRLTFIPDGNGEFTDGMGMLVGKQDLGFGRRSWRYSMLVRDGVIEKMFIEPEVDGDPFEVSDADTMLAFVDPHAAKPLDVAVITRPGCGHCARAKAMLAEAGIDFEEIALGDGVGFRSVRAIAGAGTVPQVFVDARRVGGADDVEEWLAGRAARAA